MVPYIGTVPLELESFQPERLTRDNEVRRMPKQFRDKMTITPPLIKSELTFLERSRQAAELLELIDAERGLLEQLPIEDRERLHRAVAQMYNPDPIARRRKQKIAERARNEAQPQRPEAVLQDTGIRALRRKPLFTTPTDFAPEGFDSGDVHLDTTRELRGDEREPECEESIELQHCYVCKRRYSVIHHFYDQMCPKCAEFNFAKRTELADLTGRVALLTGGRVKIGYQAGLKLLRTVTRK